MKKLPNTYNTILVMGLGFLVIYYLFNLPILLVISSVILLISLLSRKAAEKIVWVWVKLAMVLGWVNSRILLSITFYFILAPIAVIYRLTGNDSLQLKTGKKTYYTERNHTYVPKDLEKPY